MTDTLEIYIKLCEKAKEIQQDWSPAWGDWWYKPPHKDNPEHGVLGLCVDMGYNYFFPKTIWLPRQDQLQEMLRRNSILRFPQLSMAFANWIEKSNYLEVIPPLSCGGHNYGEATSCPFTSMEQLWLAFVMNNKFKKTWSIEKEEWI